MIKDFSHKELESLKQDMSYKTWIGEYIGNEQCQHLVKYPRETIIFYSIVDNNSAKICKLPEDCFKLFKKYNFPVVRMERLGVYSDYDRLCDDLLTAFMNVAKDTIQNEEEGAVLYLVKRDREDPKQDDIISLAKLKTLEYRLFRKMREKLRNYLTMKTSKPSDVIIEDYIKECKDLCRGYEIPHPLEYYIDLCVTAF